MVVLPTDATDEEILAVARAWADLIALGDFAGAQDLLSGGRWTLGSVRERLETFGAGVLPPRSSRGKRSASSSA